MRIGVVTGSGPEAGIDLWAKILEENRIHFGTSYRGDVDAPDVTILSVPELGYSMDLANHEELVWEHLRAACERIASQVDVFAIACNTLYRFEPDIDSLELSATLVSPIDCVLRESDLAPGETLALLGTTTITDLHNGASPYARLLASVDIELHPDPERTHRLIEQIKLAGGPTVELEDEFAAIVAQLDSEVALLACTELPLLAATGITTQLLDVTRLLARGLLHHPL